MGVTQETLAYEGEPAAQYTPSQPVSGVATAADPAYGEGLLQHLSMTLSGALRVALAASSVILGKVSIDQTTPGVTNGVQLNGTGTWVDKSGTVTLGGTAQQIAASNASRRGFIIQNNSSGDLWFSTLATAVVSQPSMKVASGQAFSVTAPDVPTGAISIIGATTSQSFTAREW